METIKAHNYYLMIDSWALTVLMFLHTLLFERETNVVWTMQLILLYLTESSNYQLVVNKSNYARFTNNMRQLIV